MPDQETVRKLKEYTGKQITVRHYTFLIVHHADESPSFPQVHKRETTGVLSEANNRNIVINRELIPFYKEDDPMTKGLGVPVGCSYSTTGEGIHLIVAESCFGKEVLYRGTVPGD